MKRHSEREMRSFPATGVILKDPVFRHRQELVRKYLAEFDLERLMYSFRKNAGMESDAEPLEGWENPGCELRGHFVGHFLAACAKFAGNSGDRELKQKADAMVEIMEACADENGYLSAFEEEQLDTLEEKEDTGVWAPYYTLHKILNGLVCCGKYCENEKAVRLAENLGLYIYRRFQKLSYWKIDNILRCTRVNPVNEFGGIGDALYTLWEMTEKEEILELAKLFDRDYLLRNMVEGNDVLSDLHANTHLPMITGALHRYAVTGEETYRKAGVNFYRMIRPRTFANGNSSSRAEHFLRGGVSEQAEHWGANRLDRTYLTGGESESCCAHNTEKILEYLLRYDPEHRLQYLEHLESLKYNAVLNAFSGKTGLSQYHQPMGADSRKKFSSPYGDFWCCTGSGVEAAAELQKNIWFEEKGRIFLNMFVSSELHLEEPKATLCLQSEFPKKPRACLQVETDQAISLELAFRQSGVKNVQAHGAVCETSCEDGFLVVTGTFGEGSFLELELQAEIREVPLGKEKEIYCLKYGPVLLAEIAGTYVRKEPLCLNSEGDFTGRDCVFRPLYLVEEETYTVYLNSGENTEAKDGSSAYA